MCSLWGSRNVILSDGYHCPRAQFAYRFGHALHGDRNISKEAGALTQLTTLASIICLPPNPFSLALMGNAQHLDHGDPLPPFSISSLGGVGYRSSRQTQGLNQVQFLPLIIYLTSEIYFLLLHLS